MEVLEPIRKSINIGGRELTMETGRFAKQAGGSVYITYGDTAVMATATASKEPRDGIDFFPLTVDYEERFYAVGKIPGGFIKREGRPSEKAILSSRLIDRPIRPLFPKGYRNDVHLVPTVMSVDQDNPPDILSMVGVSAALHISSIPFLGPIAAVSVGLINNEIIINPSVEQTNESKLHLVVAGTKDAVMMVEAGANEISEETILEAIMTGHEEIKKLVQFIEEFREEALSKGLAKEKEEPVLSGFPQEIDEQIREYAQEKLTEAIKTLEKQEREKNIKAVKEETVAHFEEIFPEDIKVIKGVLDVMTKEIVRKLITVDKLRPDGRALDEIRPITCEIGVLPRAHGSGLFTRGQTQILSVVTLGAIGEEQIIDGLGTEESKRYIHHYNFPPYSVGEARPMRGPGRREIGHGVLAERALVPMIPTEEDFPYTIRVVSEALESNGSTSQASICGSTLSLLDAGVPLIKPVAGIAMGLVKHEDYFSILTDIQGMEDALGDMDFKVAGTREGVTAIQMDIKISGISKEILKDALEQARKGRLFILDKMEKLINKPREELSPYAPRIITMNVHPDKIRTVIGPGGKTIKKIIDETGVKIDIEDDGKIFISSTDLKAAENAIKVIENLTKDLEVEQIYLGKVTRITKFGAFVEVLPGKEGLVHISQLSAERVEKVEDVVAVGDEILVKVVEIDRQGRVNLSRKVLLAEQNKEDQK
ncbi:polyribonucleotide nucleotidyltransferase [Desulfonispora thiosulfatigenes DSM 11270]|uniref:Polyribonucleotide nucleotidyltransferase n=1 Tax=Desulfonispora thiosulfatigenes DSM 11270 TaxID=656914 RepID=A0A1W1VL63_DESTI|nr:polyribonucleotide nucleotidyltransferase [Desulfonispora thiosulfatigenes DSM 11270]